MEFDGEVPLSGKFQSSACGRTLPVRIYRFHRPLSVQLQTSYHQVGDDRCITRKENKTILEVGAHRDHFPFFTTGQGFSLTGVKPILLLYK